MTQRNGHAQAPSFWERRALIRGAQLGPTQKLLLYVLSDYLGDNGQAWPSQSQLAADCGLSTRQLRTVLQSLAPVVTVHRRRRSTALYSVDWPALQERKCTSGQLRSRAEVDRHRNTQRSNTQQEHPGSPHSPPSANGHSDELDRLAESLYQAYPRKEKKPAALKVIRKALQSVAFDELMAAVEEFADAKADVERQYVPHPATWFNQRRWEDDRSNWYEQRKGRQGRNKVTQAGLQDFVAKGEDNGLS